MKQNHRNPNALIPNNYANNVGLNTVGSQENRDLRTRDKQCQLKIKFLSYGIYRMIGKNLVYPP